MRVIWKGRNRQLPSPGADGNEPLWKEQNQEKIKKLAAEEQKVENERGKLRFWAELGHLMYKVKHRTREGIDRARGSLVGVCHGDS